MKDAAAKAIGAMVAPRLFHRNTVGARRLRQAATSYVDFVAYCALRTRLRMLSRTFMKLM